MPRHNKGNYVQLWNWNNVETWAIYGSHTRGFFPLRLFSRGRSMGCTGPPPRTHYVRWGCVLSGFVALFAWGLLWGASVWGEVCPPPRYWKPGPGGVNMVTSMWGGVGAIVCSLCNQNWAWLQKLVLYIRSFIHSFVTGRGSRYGCRVDSDWSIVNTIWWREQRWMNERKMHILWYSCSLGFWHGVEVLSFTLLGTGPQRVMKY
jgi:hypothetical protein